VKHILNFPHIRGEKKIAVELKVVHIRPETCELRKTYRKPNPGWGPPDTFSKTLVGYGPFNDVRTNIQIWYQLHHLEATVVAATVARPVSSPRDCFFNEVRDN
jgi:hypothetical protein